MDELDTTNILLALLLLVGAGILYWFVRRMEQRDAEREFAEWKAEREAWDREFKQVQEESKRQAEIGQAEFREECIEKLRLALARKDFEEADSLTAYIIGPRSDADTLRRVDQLWVEASGGRFGPIVQARLAPLPEKCLELAEIPWWYSWGGRIYDLSAPRGHLPNEWLYGEPMGPDMDDDRQVETEYILAIRETLRILTFERYLPK